MKKLIYIFSLLLFYSICISETYYVADSTNPDAIDSWGAEPSDGNTGLSWDDAFSTLNHAMSEFSCGDSIEMSTGRWYGQAWENPTGFNSGCDEDGLWTVVGCSSLTEETKNLAFVTSGYILDSNWISHSGHIWKLPWSSTDTATSMLNEMTFTSLYTLCLQSGGYDTLIIPQRDRDGEPAGDGLNLVDVAGEFYHDDINDTIYSWFPDNINPNNYLIWATLRPIFFFKESGINRFEVRGLDLQGGKKCVIHWGDEGVTDSVKISYCNITKAGGMNTQNVAVISNMCMTSGDIQGTHIYACSIGVSVQTPGTVSGGLNYPPSHPNCYNQGIESYCQDYITIEQCHFYGTHENAIYFKNEYNQGDEPYVANNAKFNTIIQRQTSDENVGIKIDEMPSYDSIYGNVIIGSTIGVYFSYGSGGTTGHEDSLGLYNYFVCNNTFINVTESFMRMTHDPVMLSCGEFVEGDTNKFMYNLCYGNDWQNISYSANYLTFRSCPTTLCQENWLFDYNAYYDSTSAFLGRLSNGDTSTSVTDLTWTQWQDSGYDANSYFYDYKVDTISTYVLPEGTSLTMNYTYGGQTWTKYGAIQDAAEAEETDTLGVIRLKGLYINGGFEIGQ